MTCSDVTGPSRRYDAEICAACSRPDDFPKFNQCRLNLAPRSPVSQTERQSSFGTNHSPDLCQMMVIVLRDKVQMIHKPHRLHQARVQLGPCKEFMLKLS